MPHFTKKPVTIEAFRWNGGPDQEDEPNWITDAIRSGSVWFENSGTPDVKMVIRTLEGDLRANIGDWIIKGVKGELYPCKPDIFAATYDAAGVHSGLPVKGYQAQSSGNVDLVNENKVLEERVLRQFDFMARRIGEKGPGVLTVDGRWLAIARTQIEQGFMAMNRAVFQPARLSLPGDAVNP